jgi:hypothetical protein
MENALYYLRWFDDLAFRKSDRIVKGWQHDTAIGIGFIWRIPSSRLRNDRQFLRLEDWSCFSRQRPGLKK